MPSVQSLMIRALLHLIGRRRKYGGERTLRAHLRIDRRRGPAPPPRCLRRRAAVETVPVDGHAVVALDHPAALSAQAPHIFYLHGGAYLFDIVVHHWRFLSRLMHQTPCHVTVPLYPLAPEATCRDVFDWLVPIYGALAARHNPEHLVIMGDSAGGGMALALAQVLLERGLPQPGAIVLISPWLDAALTHPDIDRVARRDPMLQVPGLRVAGRWYAGDLAVDHPMVSPINGPLAGLAPLTLFMGTDDILWPDARRLAALAAGKGAALDYWEAQRMFHVWLLLNLPESRAPLARLTSALPRCGVRS